MFLLWVLSLYSVYTILLYHLLLVYQRSCIMFLLWVLSLYSVHTILLYHLLLVYQRSCMPPFENVWAFETYFSAPCLCVWWSYLWYDTNIKCLTRFKKPCVVEHCKNRFPYKHIGPFLTQRALSFRWSWFGCSNFLKARQMRQRSANELCMKSKRG